MLVQSRPSGRRIFVHANIDKENPTRFTRSRFPTVRRGGHESNYRRFARINTNRNLIRIYHRSLQGLWMEKSAGFENRNSFFFFFFFFPFARAYYFPIDTQRCGVITQMNSNGSRSDTIQTGKNQPTNDSAARCNYLAG